MDKFISQELIGFLAAFLTTIAFIPQLVKTWVSKSAEDVSLIMFLSFIGGVILWCIYGIEIHSLPVIIANSITFLLSSSILILKIIYEYKPKEDRLIIIPYKSIWLLLIV